MFLSFIVTVYNAEKYLQECLDSLAEQDISSEEYEIICVDDGSTDSSSSILHAFEKKHKNVIIISKSNGGVSSARNTGIDNSHGDYIWFIDSDDFIQRNCLQEIQKTAVQTQCDAIQFGAYYFKESLSAEEVKQSQNRELMPNTYANNIYVTRSIFKSDILKTNGFRFCEKLRYSEDKLFISEFLSVDPQISRIEKLVYYYRLHGGSAISHEHLTVMEKRIENWSITIAAFQKLYQQCPQRYKAQIADNLMSEVYNCLYTAASTSDDNFQKIYSWIMNQRIIHIKRPAECTITKSYLSNSKGLKTQIIDFLYLNTNSFVGFWTARLAFKTVQFIKNKH